jgi:NADH-quinone oxidoreductase subunit J
MLLNLGQPGQLADTRALKWKLAAGVVGAAMLAELFTITRSQTVGALTLPVGIAEAALAQNGAVGNIAGPLFTTYLLPFEITSVLLLAAIVGAVMVGKQRSANAR